MTIHEGNETEHYRKACECSTTATTGRIIFAITNGPDEPGGWFTEDKVKHRVTHYPGPVCDGCDTPWESREAK